ncbi:hypothetical protein ACLI08_16175 [Flavobacterium sp. RNTU_13]|uniref:hypothetical protein n=1 Tax=Flavobacterium sp. RNTU_13 TaxID=3375145 RepID=UPI003986106B
MKKTLNIVLLIVVLMLWGTAIYRYVGGRLINQDSAIPHEAQWAGNSNLNISRDTFTLKPLAYDPFLKTIHYQANNNNNVPYRSTSVKKALNVPKIPVPQPITELPVMPDILYFGYIKSGSCEETALVKVNGKSLRIGKGQTKEGVTVKGCNRKNLVITFSGKEVTIPVK